MKHAQDSKTSGVLIDRRRDASPSSGCSSDSEGSTGQLTPSTAAAPVAASVAASAAVASAAPTLGTTYTVGMQAGLEVIGMVQRDRDAARMERRLLRSALATYHVRGVTLIVDG